jgi:SAM-dependent methyltransferase
LQLLTIFRFLHAHLRGCRGRLLDVGAGEGPWREMLPDPADYVGVDVDMADDFGMTKRPGITYYDGITLPFDDSSFEQVLCTEVLEHVSSPIVLLQDIHRVLAPGGSLILTVPWSARVHHLPHDYFRFTVFGLRNVLGAAGFSVEVIEERGNDIAVIANKMVVVAMRLLSPSRPSRMLWALPMGLCMGLVSGVFLCSAHIALFFDLGAKEDPLGYGVLAKKITNI